MATLTLDTGRSAINQQRRRGLSNARPGRQTKFQEVCGRLSDLAHELGPDAKLPTVIELRDRLGVSIATLNSVLTELESQRVVRRRHGVGIYVAPDIRQHRVALICDPSFFHAAGTSPFWSLLVDQLRRRAEAEREAFSMYFATAPTDSRHGDYRSDDLGTILPYLGESLIEELKNGRMDAVLGIGLPQVTADWIERQGIPFVAFAGPAQYVVGLDGDEVVRQGVAVLCGLDCKRIAYWSPIAPYRHTTPEAESEAVNLFAETLSAHGRRFDPDLVWDNQHLVPGSGGIHTLSHQEQGYHAAMEAFGTHTDRDDWPDAIFSTDDMLTQGLLTALQRLEVRVGTDVQIATHANAGSPVLLGWEDRLTRLEVSPAQVVCEMFDAVEALLHGKEPKAEVICVPPRLRPIGEL